MLSSNFSNINCSFCNTQTDLSEDCIEALKICFEENFKNDIFENHQLAYNKEFYPLLNGSCPIPEQIEEVDEDEFSEENVN